MSAADELYNPKFKKIAAKPVMEVIGPDQLAFIPMVIKIICANWKAYGDATAPKSNTSTFPAIPPI